MKKVALVIGVSEYPSDGQNALRTLPASVKDATAIQRVLSHPDFGKFDTVHVLTNPEPQEMRESIETVFSGRDKEDAVVLFFSGHGVKDDLGRLHLATSVTKKNPRGELIRSTAVEAKFVQDCMDQSRAQRQVVILDCCFSGAFAEGMSAKDDGAIGLKEQLGGKGRAILSSSTSTQYSMAQEGLELSAYTHFLIEGIETGAADFNQNGQISVEELHRYAKQRVQESVPSMSPEIIVQKDGAQIYLIESPSDEKKYREDVAKFGRGGVVSAIGRKILDKHINNLKLTSEQAFEIEHQILVPLKEYQDHLKTYANELRKPNLTKHELEDLDRFRLRMELKDDDVAAIKNEITKANENNVTSDKSSDLPSSISTSSAHTSSMASSNEAVVNSDVGIRKLGNRILSGFHKLVYVLGSFVLIIFVILAFDTSAEDYFKAGVAKFNEKKYAEAIMQFTSAIEKDQEKSDYFLKRAEAYEASLDQVNVTLSDDDKRNLEFAIADYTSLIGLEPTQAKSFVRRGELSEKLQKSESALKDFKQALALDSNNFDALFGAGRIEYLMRNYSYAIDAFTQAIRIAPHRSEVFVWRGYAKHATSDTEGAQKDYLLASQIDPNLVPDAKEFFTKRNKEFKQAGAVGGGDELHFVYRRI